MSFLAKERVHVTNPPDNYLLTNDAKPMPAPSLVWFRQDLRIADNPALIAAIARGGPVIPIFIWAPEDEGRWPAGAASRWWLHHSLQALAGQFQALGAKLIIRQGITQVILRELVRVTSAGAVFWNRRYEPEAIQRDTSIKSDLKKQGLFAESHNGSLLYEPWDIKTKVGGPYQVFTPFSKACLAYAQPPHPLMAPTHLSKPAEWPASTPINELRLLPKIHWDAGLYQSWQPGVVGAESALAAFCPQSVRDYSENRNRPDLSGTSRLSPALHFGEVSPRQIWHFVSKSLEEQAVTPGEGEPYLRQLLWREFAHHLLFHFPQTPTAPLRENFSRFPWKPNTKGLRAWQQGETGYPIVDAGMRELWTTGWMHNRVRMIVASFLVKDLLVSWQSGADWFWDTLVDADLANNTLGWQWTAGCGADAAPYFRIFNPTTQGKKFDPDGTYIRRWIPELAGLSSQWIHEPIAAPAPALRDAKIELGATYPRPVVDHDEARQRALEALKETRDAD
jgi:deoxyribodipyrimidine photo-lyase